MLDLEESDHVKPGTLVAKQMTQILHISETINALLRGACLIVKSNGREGKTETEQTE